MATFSRPDVEDVRTMINRCHGDSSESVSPKASTTTTTKKSKKQAPQEIIDEFWTKFNTKTPGKATTILPADSYAKKVGDSAAKGTITSLSSSASYEEAVRTCKLKVTKIVKECRRANQKYRDPHFDIEFDLKWGKRDCLETLKTPNREKSIFRPKSVKRVGDIFENPQFFINGPEAKDIRQGQDGDCWLLAGLCTLSNKKGLIERVCVARDEAVGVYGFVFYRDSEWRSEIIDDKLYLTKPDYDESILERLLWEDRERVSSEDEYKKVYQTNSGALYFAQCEDPNETWLPLLEKAYAKAHGDFATIDGGYTGEGIEDLTGGVTMELFSTDILDKNAFWSNELLRVNEEFLFGCSSCLFAGWGERKGIIEGHAYSIMRAVEMDGQRLLLLKNPWGKGEWTGPWSDGSKEWTPEWMMKLDHRFGDDGAFWISYDDFLKKYQTFDRTRLFTDDWKVTHQWTSLTIPWSVDYNSTKFAFTINKPASVVVVLNQLDGRYFRGLEGQYTFELSFRIHKAGEEDYIIRSHTNYCMKRSVAAELDLDEAGEYLVLVKITAKRDFTALPAHTVIRDNAKDRRDKLLRIGLAYDLAHAKGHVEESEDDKKAREKAEARAKAKERKEIKDKLTEKKKKKKRSEAKTAKRERARQNKAKARAEAREKKEADKKKLEGEVKKPEEEAAAEAVAEKAESEKADTDMADTEKTDTEKSGSEKAVSENADAEKPSGEKPEVKAVNNKEPAAEGADPAHSQTPASSSTRQAITEAALDQLAAATGDSSRPARSTRKNADRGVSPLNHARSAPRDKLNRREAPIYDSDDSDTDSCVSSVSDSTIDAEIEKAKLPTPVTKEEKKDKKAADDESEDEFEKDPWNAVAVVGLRVYAKAKEVEKEDEVEVGGSAGSEEVKVDSGKKEVAAVKLEDKAKGDEEKVEGPAELTQKTESATKDTEDASGKTKEEKLETTEIVTEDKPQETASKTEAKEEDPQELEVSIRVIRPRTWEDGEASLDVDDSAMDATKNLAEESDNEDGKKKVVIGMKGSLGAVSN
ncbi:hypothetical protein V501_01497 [Pseudogymnoascus sp. VKM F-4519 (FW-2642)]|nr:hypothetical protein V501_01497 [Pseudogymnoascus sp. VKM F-4519 (FW-2642)]